MDEYEGTVYEALDKLEAVQDQLTVLRDLLVKIARSSTGDN